MDPEPTVPKKDDGATLSAPIKGDQGTEDLHNEGVDIVGSSVALDNEFSKPEEEAANAVSPSDDTSDEAPKMKDIDAESAPEALTPAPTSQAAAPLAPTPGASAGSFQPIPTMNPIASPAQAPAIDGFQSVPTMEPKIPLQNDPSIKPLRTYKSDAEEAVKYGGVSKATIVLAEQKRREANGTAIEYSEPKTASPGLYIAIVAIATILLGGGWYVWFSMSSNSSSAQDKAVAPQVSLVGIVPFAKAGVVLIAPNDSDSDPIALLAAKIAATTPALGTVAAIAPVTSATSTTMMAISNVLSSTHIPSRLLRSLGDQYMAGSYEYDVQSPFIILKNTYYQNAYAGMLEWEPSIGADLLPLIQISSPGITGLEASTATFSDSVISNINVRLLKAGDTVLLAYGFADKDTIVIATTPTALKYLLNQLLQVRTIQ